MKTQSAVGAFPDLQSTLCLVRFGSTEFTESTDDHPEDGDISDVELPGGCHEDSVNPLECCGSLSRSSRRPQGNGCVASQRPSPPTSAVAQLLAMNRAFNADHEERLSRLERVYGPESTTDDDDNEETF